MTSKPTLAQMRHYAVVHSIGRPGTLLQAIERLGYVQADPIRAPARAQDLILRHRVRNYRNGDIDRRYQDLPIEEDHFMNYGFLARELASLLHPRDLAGDAYIESLASGVMQRVLDFVIANGPTHPRDLQAAFGKQSVGSYWGGSTDAATRALDALRYRGELRVARRDNGIKVYERATAEERAGELFPGTAASTSSASERARRLLRAVVNLYGPFASPNVAILTRFIRHTGDLREAMKALLKRPEDAGITVDTVDGVRYYWLADSEFDVTAPDRVRFLAPFDPIVWDRTRFEHFHGWAYRFEAYTPAAKRIRGYYALPLLWRERVIGWANVSMAGGELAVDLGFAGARPTTKIFARELEAEIARFRTFMRPSTVP